jgi:O-antigen ligase
MGGQDLASKGQNANLATDGTTRKEIWKPTWELAKHNPWTGVGFGAYFLGITQYQDASGRSRVQQAHNDYLDLAAGGGIIAVVLAAFFIGFGAWGARSALRSPDPFRRAAALGAVAGILSVGVHSFVDFGLQVTGIALVFATLIVIAVTDIPIKRESRDSSGGETGKRGTVKAFGARAI